MTSTRKRHALVLLVVVVSNLLWLAACGSNGDKPGVPETPDASSGIGADDATTTTTCSAGKAGCACADEGAVASCGRLENRDGNYVTCSMGYSTCTGGSWGTCVGDRLVTRSAPSVVMTTSGIHTLSGTSIACTDVCDPNGCLSTLSNPGDVDASGIAPISDGGITLQDGTIEAGADGGCFGLACNIANCTTANVTTTLSGTVYDPAGNNPLYNAEVYIPEFPKAALPPFSSGASCDTCGGAGSLDAVQATTTDAAGNFTLTNVPTIANLPVVVQLGKWRREIVLKNITSCQGNSVTNNCTTASAADCIFRLPKNHTDGWDPVAQTYSKGDLPQVAIVSGSADPFDCLLLKAGIDPAEFGDYTSTKRFHFYKSSTGGGDSLDGKYGMNVAGATLWNNLSGATPAMTNYDVILLPCEGGAYDKQGAGASNTPYANLISYADQGGRVFTTHFSYSWLEYPAGKSYVAAPDNWSKVANWAPTGTAMTGTIDTQDPMLGTVNTSFPKGSIYSQWLQNTNATTTPSQLTIHEGRQDLTTIGANPQTWMTAHDNVYATAPDYTALLTFNAPLASANVCGRVVYSDFHVSASALVSGSSACLTNADCGFTGVCNGAKATGVGSCSEPCGSNADCPNGGFACTGSTPGTCDEITCTTNSQCGNGRVCQGGQCTCAGNTDCNGGTCGGMICSVISCTSSAQCGKGTCGGGTCGTGKLACHSTADCGLGTCGGTGHTGTCAAGTICHSNAACGIGGTCGSGTGATVGTCSTGATVCHQSTDCDSNSCGTGTGATAGICANGATHVCHSGADCDSNSCGTGTGATAGTCAIPGGTVCHKNGDCDSNVCGSGTGGAAGTCSTSAIACHKPTDCDSNSCGAGTGSATGTCASGAGTACHKNADCDSSSCGTGSGATGGTCSSTLQSCHAATQCDSGSCTGGTCSFTTGHACHANTDCDGGNCGTGAKGTCAKGGGLACHKNLDCDSNVCGSGTAPSLKGVCTAGACTTSTQCGTGGVCNALTQTCTLGACSLDTNCGTSGGVCTGATCSTPATCASDAACVSSLSCTGATCGVAPACTGDSTCSSSKVCNGATCTSMACAQDTSCTATGLCNGAKCSTSAACAGDAACTSSKSCTGAKCSTLACAADTTCTVGGLCNNAKCSTPATCAGDAACLSSKTCNNAKCSTPATCAGDSKCPSSGLCTGSKCSTLACAADTTCTVGGLCNNAKCSTSTCSGDSDCPTGLCSGSSCTYPATCATGSDCGTKGTCSSTKCAASACGSGADCGTGSICGGICQPAACTKDSDCGSNLCVNGACGCVSTENCGGAQTCNNEVPGTCGRACAQNSDCAPDFCVNGQCGGCTNSSQCHDNGFAAACGGLPASNYGTCTNFNASAFPEACRQGTLSGQEKALEFMFFDLTSCVTPDNAAPPPLNVQITGYPPATFTQDYVAACPPSASGVATRPVWREFDWQAQIPSGTSIVFSAQSGATTATLLPASPLLIDTATTSTNTGPLGTSFDVALIDTGAKGTGAFDVATPPVASTQVLRVTITLNPTADFQQAPTLDSWKVQYDCPAVE
jgi:hypothetical protein